MKLPKTLATLAVIALLAAALAGCAESTTPPAAVDDAGAASVEAAKPVVTVAIQPTDNAEKIMSSADELEAFLEQRTGFEIEIVVPMTNAGVIEALRFGHADVAFLGSWPAALAVDKADARLVLAEKREVLIGDQAVVEPYYFSYYVVLEDSEYQTFEDLRGKTVAYTSPTSTSGYVYPVARLVELDLITAAADGKQADPSEFFGQVFLAGGYGQAWEALQSGQADVAVIAGDVKASLYNEVLAGTRVLEQQGPVPSHAVVFAKDFEGAEAESLEDALLELKGEKRDLMRNLVSGIFVEFVETTAEQHTGPLADALELVGFPFTEKLG